MNDRIDKHKYAMQLAEAAAQRSTCLRRKVGAVAIDRNGYVLATAYNGAPRKMKHCTATPVFESRIKSHQDSSLKCVKLSMLNRILFLD